ncbi:hypothetical protein N7532_001288 [Penicillium argentinense]|uniref:Oxysterol-binding protein-like protein 1 n=1 Tax=Penicillium argentinense TaxID=1131581 RepID=A0A9W9G2B4_9EURO|nr:uncharacterized protein N7532_001288 [Penicillium argentinense]KAJ5110753.1 hypothetical protein N7532_001288 [Penicillium argentinense]
MSSAVAEKTPDDSSKLKTFLSILRKYGPRVVLLERAKNLRSGERVLIQGPKEYWNYLDRPETFASIGKSDDELGRMLEVLRFWFTKDLKYIKGKAMQAIQFDAGRILPRKSGICSWEVPDFVPEEANLPGVSANGNGTSVEDGNEKVRISYLTEQTSHHPPVSAFYIDCAERGVSARGFDQLSAKFTGTSIRVSPGQHNLGIFVNIEKRDNEEYQLTHPHAHLGGLLRGALSITVSDACYMTCPKTRMKAILQYMEEGWIGRSQNRLEGVIFRYDPDNDTVTKVKDVRESDVLARISGSWHGKIYYTPVGSKEPVLLIDIAPLFPAEKDIPPTEQQLSNESLKFWSEVTSAILNKQYAEATKLKQDIEERQRQRAAERKEKEVEWKPRFFTGAVTPLGKPELTEEGQKVLQGIRSGEFALEESTVQGA